MDFNYNIFFKISHYLNVRNIKKFKKLMFMKFSVLVFLFWSGWRKFLCPQPSFTSLLFLWGERPIGYQLICWKWCTRWALIAWMLHGWFWKWSSEVTNVWRHFARYLDISWRFSASINRIWFPLACNCCKLVGINLLFSNCLLIYLVKSPFLLFFSFWFDRFEIRLIKTCTCKLAINPIMSNLLI